MKKLALILIIVAGVIRTYAQSCNCEMEFNHLKDFVEVNYAGFKDKKALMGDAGYHKLVMKYADLAKGPHATEKCLLIISQFLDQFKDDHVTVGVNFDPMKPDSTFIKQREIIPISDTRIAELRKSTGFEGIYNFHDSAMYKIAVIKDKTPLHDYVGIIINSNLPGWKRGMIKFEGKLISDSLAKGVLYIINQMPKQEYFFFGKNYIGGDWVREGAVREKSNYKYVPVASRKLSDQTLYIKISSFGPSNAKNIDSIIRINQQALASTPNLVLDLRGNGGGADFTFAPLMPYMYTQPVKTYGVSLLATEANIKGWQKYLEDKDLTDAAHNSIKNIIGQMEASKGGWAGNSNDGMISNYTRLPYPQKIAILIDENCASTTEQFLLYARESKKVTLMGQNTSGTLDYSNVVEAPFLCMPYKLRYSSSRSRRIDHGQGIDDTGIKPKKYLPKFTDWIEAATKYLER